MKIAFLFPGQGSQKVGMGQDLYNTFVEAKKVYDEASDILGYDVADLCFEGPKEELDKTINTQPCLLTTSIAIHTTLALNGVEAEAMAGHSLGEYSALVAGGVLAFGDAVKLTDKRARLMQDAVPEGKGLMAAILGLDREKVDEVCSAVTAGYVRPANYNCPGQIVISGETPAVEEAMAKAREAGAKRALALAVSVPSHSALMEDASKALSEFLFLEDIPMRDPGVPIVCNFSGGFTTTTDGLKACLVEQLSKPVLWEDSIKAMVEKGYDTMVEVGPGTVLCGLVKRIAPDVTLYNVQDRESLEKTVTALKK